MRFLSMIRIQENTGRVPSEQLISGVRVRLRRGKLSAADGPFTETKEVIGGYAILEAKSKEEAIELTQRFLKIHGDEWDLECELRQLDGPEFGSEACGRATVAQ
jgi:hypothetical protein